jgi:cob(I)alamin adenosyltransferase
MRIYTKTGDDGQTGLVGGTRVGKDDPRVDCYGTVDELNACLGLVAAEGVAEDIALLISKFQRTLFVLGSELATSPEKASSVNLETISPEDALELEAAIDQFNAELPELRNFILPGGRKTAAALHYARTVCRRAERRVIALSRVSPVSNAIVVYLNRLGDLLFVLARVENQRNHVPDIPWLPIRKTI